ncbi:ATP-binding protein [Mycolicibacterium mengxianglii]|uniref:ATP-binding protein n=1 Tax=Mycolicibacterium mengxianglii TaxID=2736649 RepID=UPI0018D1F4C0|nr:ATP-binding protein [Mycolicibacterium mengxianglii]
MTKTNDAVPPDSDVFLRAGVVAEPVNVARLREELEQWLRRHFALDALRLNDLVLAVNEALANVAEFAYRHADEPGPVDLRADYEKSGSVLTITVADRGTWRDSSEREPKRTRGRGIPLMEALADEVGIDAAGHGTTVLMRFCNLALSGVRSGDEVPTA